MKTKTNPVLITTKDFRYDCYESFQYGCIMEIEMKSDLLYFIAANIVAALELKGGKVVKSIDRDTFYWVKKSGVDVPLVTRRNGYIQDFCELISDGEKFGQLWNQDIEQMEDRQSMVGCNNCDEETGCYEATDENNAMVLECETSQYIEETNAEIVRFFKDIRKIKFALSNRIKNWKESVNNDVLGIESAFD